MKYLKVLLEQIVRFNNDHFEDYLLEKELSVPTMRRARGY